MTKSVTLYALPVTVSVIFQTERSLDVSFFMPSSKVMERVSAMRESTAVASTFSSTGGLESMAIVPVVTPAILRTVLFSETPSEVM